MKRLALITTLSSLVLACSCVAAPVAAQPKDLSLSSINTYVNRATRYGSPTFKGIDGVYDCEDYAWDKWALLLKYDMVPRENMRVVHLTIGPRSRREGHAVLIVRVGEKLVVLDNRYSNLATVSELERRGDVPVNGWWPE
jgi:predicted transglutaminase-like cysteine proteinase